MKTFLKISGIIIGLFILALIVIPYFFKDQLVEKVKEEANKNLNAVLEFEDVDLTFFSHFPKLTFELEELSIKGVDHFEGVELIHVASFEITIGLSKLFKGELPDILGVYIHDATINALVHPSGAANWDIVKESETTSKVEDDKDTPNAEGFSVQLNYYEISETTIRYEDQSSATLLLLDNFNHSGKGNFGASNFMLETKTSIANVLLEYEDETLINNWGLDASINLDVDLEDSRYQLSDNEIKINELLLKAEGEVVMPDSAIYMDLKIDAPSVDLKQLLSLVSNDDLKDITIGGNSSLSSWIKGNYSEKSYPLFAMDLKVNNGSFQHKDLSRAAKSIEIETHIELPNASNLDALWIDISKLNLDLGGNLIASGFTLRNPLSTMNFTSRVSASVDLSNLKDVIPSEDAETYKGIIKANLKAEGSLDEIEKENYTNLYASGKLHVENFEYSSPQFSKPVLIQKALMEFKMDEVVLESFEAFIGDSDFMADGTLKDFIPYVLFNKELYGELNARSNYLNVDEMMALMLEDSIGKEGNQVEGDITLEPAISTDTISELLPKNIHFMLRTGVSKLKYDDIELIDFQGDLELKNGVLTLNSCTAETMGGKIFINGEFDETIPSEPIAEFKFTLENMNIKESGEKIKMIQKYAPISKYADGTFSGKLTFRSVLDKDWNPIYKSVYSKGVLRTNGVKIKGFEVLDKLAKISKTESILAQEFEDVDIKYEIIDGKGYIKPFDFKIDQLSGSSYGSIALDQSIDFDVSMTVPTAILGDGASLLFGQLAGALSSIGVQAEAPENIEMDIKVTGTVDKPIIKPSFSGIGADNAKEVIKEKIEEEIDKAKEVVIARASEEADKILEDAQKKADEVLEEAQKNVNLLKEEGYAQADKLVEEASGMLEQIAAKVAASELKKQIDKQASNVMDEAQIQADKIMKDAQKQADRIKN